MARVLILTTGGSDKPLVKSIMWSKPDYTIFLCSDDDKGSTPRAGSYKMVDGEGKPCKDEKGERESIVRQCKLLPEQYTVKRIKDPDNLGLCYKACLEAINTAREKMPDAKIRADYTGGTKTMTSALAMAAVDDENIEIFIVSGNRPDLVKVSSGTETLRQADWEPILWARQQQSLKELFKSRDYKACIDLIEETCSILPGKSELFSQLNGYLVICRGLQAWEEFRHLEAKELLEAYSQMKDQLKFLRSIIRSLESYTKQAAAARGEGQGLAVGVKPDLGLVHDILRNAERRLQKRQFDDAVGRIYRALELIADIILLHQDPPLDNSALDIEKLPAELQGKYREMLNLQGGTTLQLPLFRSWELLAELKTPAGKAFAVSREKMLKLLNFRNSSIFAHGLSPVGEAQAQEFYRYVCNLLSQIEDEMKLSNRYQNQAQFPDVLPEYIQSGK